MPKYGVTLDSAADPGDRLNARTQDEIALLVGTTLPSGAAGEAVLASNTPADVRTAISVMSATEVASAITTAVNGLLNGAPGALNTLKELADAINDDASFAATVTTALSRKVGLVQAAKNPDLLVTGAVTVDGNDLVTSAAVVWPDGTVGTLTITSRDANGAVLGYNITYGSPVTATYTQPTITRNGNGAATNVPAIVVT